MKRVDEQKTDAVRNYLQRVFPGSSIEPL